MTTPAQVYEPRHKAAGAYPWQAEWERKRPDMDFWPIRPGERTPKHARRMLRWVCALCGTVEAPDTLSRCVRCGSVRFLGVEGR